MVGGGRGRSGGDSICFFSVTVFVSLCVVSVCKHFYVKNFSGTTAPKIYYAFQYPIAV